eukprot:Lithocolla_globosa_v1_NODE_2571_length_1949_cov_15.294087.p1 type:complete len:250 gc:universal NODE_2571_length_1949_cov_15.294087:1147-1896(+)
MDKNHSTPVLSTSPLAPEDFLWKKCCLCQLDTTERERCPSENPVATDETLNSTFTSFLQRVQSFRELSALPSVPMLSSSFSKFTVADFISNKASWHQSCFKAFSQRELERARDRKEKEKVQDEHKPRNRLKRGAFNNELCLFCQVDLPKMKLVTVETKEFGEKLLNMAEFLQDLNLLSKIGTVDLVAAEGHYHKNCSSAYYTRYRTAHTSSTQQAENELEKTIEARVFTQIVTFMTEESLEGSSIDFSI